MDQVDDIKSRIDIVDFIRQYLELKKTGINFSARCPFHNEKTPSFMVSPERQSFRCFGCGEGGDVITFFQKIEGLSFPEALNILGERVGVKIAFSPSANKQQKSEKELIYKINLLAAKYFKLCLHSKQGAIALKYLKDRGLSDQTIEKLKIGFAPADSRLSDAFAKKGINFQALSKAGHPERFKYRIMFPIFDTFGSIIGFSGRIIEEGLPENVSPHPKYLNTPETAVFHKSRAIYGINFAKEAIRKNKRAVLVEGQMDVAMAHEAGIEEVVASSGTALTEEHLKIISRLAPLIIFSFDEDEAGQKAAISAVEMALEMGIEAKLTKIKGYKDVGELVKADKKALAKVIDEAQAPVEWIVQKYVIDKPLSAPEKKELVKNALNFIGRFQNEIEKAHYISYLAKIVSVAEITIEKVLAGSKLNARVKEEKLSADQISIEDRLIAYLLNYYGKIPKLELKDVELDNLSYRTIYNELKSCYNSKENKATEIEKLKKNLSRELGERLDAVVIGWDKKFQEDEEEAKAEFLEIKKNLELKDKERVKNDFARAIAQAETSGDIAKVRNLMKSLQDSLK